MAGRCTHLFAFLGGILLTVTLGALDQPPPENRGVISRLSQLTDEVHYLRQFNPPVGTIMAFAGDWPPYKDRHCGTRYTEAELGWMLCDGRALKVDDYPELYNAIGVCNGSPANNHFNLPDFRGRFLRGLDTTNERDLGCLIRKPAATGGNEGNKVGTLQQDDVGPHRHPIPQLYKFPVTTLPPHEKGKDSYHIYGISRHYIGGDAPQHLTRTNDPEKPETDPTRTREETRPVNIAVYWIIKFHSR